MFSLFRAQLAKSSQGLSVHPILQRFIHLHRIDLVQRINVVRLQQFLHSQATGQIQPLHFALQLFQNRRVERFAACRWHVEILAYEPALAQCIVLEWFIEHQVLIRRVCAEL